MKRQLGRINKCFPKVFSAKLFGLSEPYVMILIVQSSRDYTQ